MPKSKFAKFFVLGLRLILIVYLGLLALVFALQRRLIYQPAKGAQNLMVQFARERGFAEWRDDAGEFIGWKKVLPLKTPHERLLIVHGNAGCAIGRAGYADQLQTLAPMDVYILEYPGYGSRAGAPSLKSLFLAADDAMRSLKKEGPVYIMGESLGTGVACHLAGEFPQDVAGMLLLAPYDRMVNVAQAHMPFLPVWFLLLDRFDSATYLKNYHGPIAMLFAGQDVVVPNRFGHHLFDGYQGPKKFWEIPDAGHNDLINEPVGFWSDLLNFWHQNPKDSSEAAK